MHSDVSVAGLAKAFGVRLVMLAFSLVMESFDLWYYGIVAFSLCL